MVDRTTRFRARPGLPDAIGLDATQRVDGTSLEPLPERRMRSTRADACRCCGRRCLCDGRQSNKLGGRHGSVAEDVEAQARDFSHALNEAWDWKMRMAVFREAAEGRSKASPFEEASPVLDTLRRLELLRIEVLVCLGHPAESR